MSNSMFAVYSISAFPAQNLCVAAFPTGYVAGSFSIIEGVKGDFKRGQAGKTIIFDIPAGFDKIKAETLSAKAQKSF